MGRDSDSAWSGLGFFGFVRSRIATNRRTKILNCSDDFTYLRKGEQIPSQPMDSMMLGVTIHDLRETAVVRCVGRIVVGETETLRKAVLSQSSRQTVVLDLARVDAIDGTGIGLLVFLHGWARAVGIDLQLMNPTRHVRELLQLTNLDSVFKILSLDDAVSRHEVVVPSAAGLPLTLPMSVSD